MIITNIYFRRTETIKSKPNRTTNVICHQWTWTPQCGENSSGIQKDSQDQHVWVYTDHYKLLVNILGNECVLRWWILWSKNSVYNRSLVGSDISIHQCQWSVKNKNILASWYNTQNIVKKVVICQCWHVLSYIFMCSTPSPTSVHCNKRTSQPQWREKIILNHHNGQNYFPFSALLFLFIKEAHNREKPSDLRSGWEPCGIWDIFCFCCCSHSCCYNSYHQPQ